MSQLLEENAGTTETISIQISTKGNVLIYREFWPYLLDDGKVSNTIVVSEFLVTDKRLLRSIFLVCILPYYVICPQQPYVTNSAKLL